MRLFTDGELVGDFIPVKKNGVAGFYDNVSEQFFPSQGADPWVAPTEVEWTGGGVDGDPADGGNWSRGTPPCTAREVAVIPDGCTVSGTVDAVTAAFNGIGGVRLAGRNSRMHMKGMSKASDMFFPVSGTGVFIAEDNATYTSESLRLNRFNTMQNFYGSAFVTNINSGSYMPYSLGMRGRSTVDVYLGGSSSNGRLSLWDGGTRADITVRRVPWNVFLGYGASYLEGNEGYDKAGWSFPQNSISFSGNHTACWHMQGPITGRTDAQNTFTANIMRRLVLDGEEKNLNLTQLVYNNAFNTEANFSAALPLEFGCPVHATARAKSASNAGQDQANIRVYSRRGVAFSYDNALDTNCFLQVGSDNPSAGMANTIDLAGHSQRLGTLGVWASADFDASEVWNENLVITSSVPATLTLYGQLRTADGAACRHVFPGRVMGAASVCIDSREEVMSEAYNWPDATVPGAIRFNCPGSETTGSLMAVRGTNEVMATATFPNLSGIVVSGSGVVKLSTSAVGTDNAAFSVAVKDPTARLELSDGVSISCNTFEIPGGQYLVPGFYSENASEGVKACEYIAGSGVVEVRNSKWMGWPAAGTALSVTMPPGTAEVITDEDIANVEALEGIVTTEGVTISIQTTLPLTINAAISGPAVITANGTGKVTLSGDNSGIVAPGHFEFTSMANGVDVANFFGLGGTNTATDVFTQSSGYLDWLTFKSVNGVFTNSAPIQLVHGSGGGNRVVMGAEGAGDVLVFANDVTLGGNSGENYWYVTNGVRFVDGVFKMGGHVRIVSTAGASLKFVGESVAELGRGGDQSILYFSGVVFGGRSVEAKKGLATDYDRNIKFSKANCLGTNCVIAAYANGETNPHFDFCGYDQVISRLAQSGTGVQFPKITSAAPATLKAAGPAAAAATLRYVFTGALGYWHDVEQDLTLLSKSTSLGDLKVTKGSLTFSGAGGWVGKNVTVGSGASLVCSAADSLNAGRHVLTVESGGTLSIAEGVMLKVSTATFGSVTLPQDSTFTVAEANAIIAGSGATLTGGGTIQTGAKSIPGEWTGWPEAGTVDKVQVPDDTVAEVYDADLEKLAALGEVECGIGTKIVFKTTAGFVDLTSKFSGGVEIEVFTDGSRFVLNADNSGLISPAGFTFSNTTVVVSNRYGLGSTSAAPATFWPPAPFTTDGNLSRLYFDGPDAVSNDCALVFNYGCQMGHLDPEVRFVQANNVVQRNGSTAGYGRFGIRNDLTIAAGCSLNIGSAGTSLAVDAKLRIEDGATLNACGNFGSGTYYMAGDYVGYFNIEQCMKAFVLERENTISGASYLSYIDGSLGTFYIDLNGFDQTIPYIKGNSYWNAKQQTLTVTSSVPATLTVTAAKTPDKGISVRFLDQASYTKCGAHTQTVGCATSVTRGKLTVNEGALALERNAKWTVGDIVLNGGALIVRASAMTNTFGSARKTLPSMYVNGDAKLRLESTETIPGIGWVFVGGKSLDRGVYSAANCDWIEGEGSIRVRRGVGTVVIVR